MAFDLGSAGRAESDAGASTPDRRGRSGRPRRRLERVAAVAATVLSAAVLTAILVSHTGTSGPDPSLRSPATPAERGDPAAAQKLADQANQVSTSDPKQALRLLIAASVLAPDRATYRHAVARAVLDDTAPAVIASRSLGAGGPVTAAAIAPDGSFVVTSRDRGQVWHTYDPAGHRTIRDPLDLDEPVTGAAASLARQGANLIISTPAGVYGMLTSPALTRDGARLTDPADLVAVTVQGTVAATTTGDTATLWRPDLFNAHVLGVLPYDRTVTSVAFAPSPDPILAAGHDDGSVTIDAIDLASESTARQTLTASTHDAITSVAVSADGSTVLATHANGTATVWQATDSTPRSTTTVTAPAEADGPGTHQTWLSYQGDVAFIAGVNSAPMLWTIADGQLQPLLNLDVHTDAAVPAMISYDGRTLVTIGRDNTLTLWDLSSIMDTIEDPLPRACPLAQITDQVWRQIAPDTAYANPCPRTGPPTLNVNTGVTTREPNASGSTR